MFTGKRFVGISFCVLLISSLLGCANKIDRSAEEIIEADEQEYVELVSIDQADGEAIRLDAEERPPKPKALPYYEVERMQSLTLNEMNFQELKRLQVDGVTAVYGKFHAFKQTFPTVDGDSIDLDWKQLGLVCLPSSPTTIDDKVPAYTIAMHAMDLDSEDDFRSTVDWCVDLAIEFDIPVLLHGWDPNVVAELGVDSYSAAQVIMFDQLLKANISHIEDLPLDGRYLVNGYPLAKANMVAITFLARIIEQDLGLTMGNVAAMGQSKEGIAHWILGALDDRITVLAPGGSAHQDWLYLGKRIQGDFDCAYPHDLGWLQDWELYTLLVKVMNWMATTEAGRYAAELNRVARWQDELSQMHIIANGDLGTEIQHDVIYPLLTESRYFEETPPASWQYVRAYDAEGLNGGEMAQSIYFQIPDTLVDGVISPATPQVSVQIQVRFITVTAVSEFAVPEQAEMRLIYALAKNRSLRTPEVWHDIGMKRQESGKYQAQVEVPEGKALTYMVVAREFIEADRSVYWRSASSLPKELFPLPEPSCSQS